MKVPCDLTKIQNKTTALDQLPKSSSNSIALRMPTTHTIVRPVIDHEFRHNIVKVAVDSQGDSSPGKAEWIGRLLWQCYDEIHCLLQDRRIKK